jgi:hypothetical protein
MLHLSVVHVVIFAPKLLLKLQSCCQQMKRSYLQSIMNSTCIDMRVLGPNIYMYKRGKCTKNSLEKYINANGYNTSNTLSNS